MPFVEFGGTAEFDLFGHVEVPDGVSPREFAESPEGQEAISEAFAEHWFATGPKLRDAKIVVTLAADPETGDEVTVFGKGIKLE